MSLFLKEFVSSLIYETLEEDKFSDIVKQNPDIAQKLEYFKGIKPKYLPWIAKQLKFPGADSEEIMKLISDFDIFVQQNTIKEKDINKYDTVLHLKWTIDAAKENPSKTQARKKAKKDVDVIYNNQEWLILEPKSMEASCYYGYGTKWCISAKLNNVFDSYQKNEMRFIFVIDKKDNKKFAISLSSDEQPYVYNDNDDVVDIKEFARTDITQNILDIINSKTKEITGLDLYRNITISDVFNNPIEELKNVKSFDEILPKMQHQHRMKVLIDVGKFFLEHDAQSIPNNEKIRRSYRNLFEYEMNDINPNDNSYEELLSLIQKDINVFRRDLWLLNTGINILRYKTFLKQQGIKEPFKLPGNLAFPFFFSGENILADLPLNLKQTIENNNLSVNEKRNKIIAYIEFLIQICKSYSTTSDLSMRGYSSASQRVYQYDIHPDFSINENPTNFSKNEQKDIEMLLYWINLYINSGYNLKTLIKL